MFKIDRLSFIVPLTTLCVLFLGWLTASQISYAQTQAWTCNDISQISRQECDALQALFDAGFGRDGEQGVAWFSSRTPCLWGRGNNLSAYLDVVKCDNVNGTQRVTFLRTTSDVQTIPAKIGDLQWLHHLTVENNALIRWLPSDIGRITSLHEMFITNNSALTTLPSEIGNLSNLARLVIKNNSALSTLPSQIGNLGKLNVVDLSANRLTTLPPNIENIGRSTTWGVRLDVSHNPFTSWPQTITNLQLSSLEMFGVCESSTPAFQTWINNIQVVRGRSGTFCSDAGYPPAPIPPNGSTPCPASGAWPAGCVPGGSTAPTPPTNGGSGQPCPASGAWPAGCVPGGSTTPTPPTNGGSGQPCPASGAWPAGCVPGGSTTPTPPTNGGPGQPCPASGAWPAGCVPVPTPAPYRTR